MKTPCRIENVNKSPSPMILRSACAHSHSTLSRDDIRIQNSNKKRTTVECTTTHIGHSRSSRHIKSLLKTSLKKIALKSTQTLSVLRGNLYSHLEFSESRSDESLEQDGNNSKSAPYRPVITTSTPISSLFVCNNFINSEDFIGDDRSFESIQATMSSERHNNNYHLQRAPLRAYSGSDTEEESSYAENRVRLKRTTRTSGGVMSSNHHSHPPPPPPAGDAASSGWSVANDNNRLNQRNSSVNSSQVDISIVQNTMVDRLRWAVWRYIYLKIISFISFDVWLLSRLHGSKKALAILLLPLVIYLLCSAGTWDSSSAQPAVSFFTSHLELSKRFIDNAVSGVRSLVPALSSFVPAFFLVESDAFSAPPPTTHSCQPPIGQEQRTIAIPPDTEAALEQRLNDLLQRIQAANTEEVQDVRGETIQLRKEVADLRHQFESLAKLLQQFKSEQKFEKSSWVREVERMSSEYRVHLGLLEERLRGMEGELVRCRHVSHLTNTVERFLVAAFKSVVAGEKKGAYSFFSEWLDRRFADAGAASASMEQQGVALEGVVRSYVEALQRNATLAGSRLELTEERVREIVREAVRLYDADKTGRADYALESAGGSIISIRCSESYTGKRGKLILLGLPLPAWWHDVYENTPRTVIQPDVHPGRCWSFRGSQGYVVIELSHAIFPTGFTMEHIPASISPTGSLDSAPKRFSVWGLASEMDSEGVLLGEHVFDDKGDPLQYFTVQNPSSVPYSFVELKIHSNHGNMDYTCLYRFRVHGAPVK